MAIAGRLALFLLLATVGSARADIIVGFVSGGTGPVATIGIPNAKGVAAGVLYEGTVAGQTLRVISLDDASEATASVRDARKLIEQENVDVLLGTSGTPQTTAMASVAVEMHVPMVAISPLGALKQDADGPWVVQIPQPVPLLMQGVVKEMAARGVHRVSYIGFSDAFGDLVHDSLAHLAAPAGIELTGDERYARTDTSVTAQVLRALSARPDAIMLGGTGTAGALPVLALRERGYKGLVFGNHGSISADFLRIAGAAADGIICPTGPSTVAEQLPADNPVRPVALAFRTAYQQANGAAPSDSFSAYGFDGWLAVADAARRAVETGAKPGTPAFHIALRDALFSTHELIGTQGIYSFAADRPQWVDERARVMVRVENGKWQLLP